MAESEWMAGEPQVHENTKTGSIGARMIRERVSTSRITRELEPEDEPYDCVGRLSKEIVQPYFVVFSAVPPGQLARHLADQAALTTLCCNCHSDSAVVTSATLCSHFRCFCLWMP